MEAIGPMWKLISLLLAVTIFLVVGGTLLTGGEEPMWAATKAMGAFLAAWFLLSQLGGILCTVADRREDEIESDLEDAARGSERG